MVQGGQGNGNSALEGVLGSLCPAHRSLLSQMLILAHQERLLSLPQHSLTCRTEPNCCHHSVSPQNNLPPHRFPFVNCRSRSGSPHYPLADYDHQVCSNTLCSPANSKFTCCCPLGESKSKASQGSENCSVESCRVPTYSVFCLENLHCISCQRLAVRQTKNLCSFASSSTTSLCPSSQVCPAPSTCCSHHSPIACLCHSSHPCFAQVRHTMEREDVDGDPPCPVLKREQSPSPPPLSPIPSDFTSKIEEKPPCLLLHSCDHERLSIVDNKHVRLQESHSHSAPAEDLGSSPAGVRQTKKMSRRSSLSEVVERFTERLETIGSQEKDPSLSSSTVFSAEKEGPPSSSTVLSIEKEGPPGSFATLSDPFNADAHLSEIITTVLHTGSDSDYNLSELFHQHDNKEAKSPNTRARRRQQVRAAMTMTPNLVSTRRQSLQMKRELAMLDPSCCRRKVPHAKRLRMKDGSNFSPPTSSSSESTPVKEESKRETEIRGELKDLTQVNHMVYGPDKLSMGGMVIGEGSGTDDGEIQRKTAKAQGEISVYSTNNGVEGPAFDGEKGESIIKSEEDVVEVKEEIQTIIVKEEIETIAVEGENGVAVEEKGNSFPNFPDPTSALLSTGGRSYSCAEGNSIRKHLGNGGHVEESLLGPSSDNDCTQFSRLKPKNCSRGLRGRSTNSLSQSNNSGEAIRSKRNIVPPQRFSSYVTEPRKMYFVACFSESIFNQRTSQDSVLQSNTVKSISQIPGVTDTQLESRNTPHSSKEPNGEFDSEMTPQEQSSNTESKDQNQAFSISMTPARNCPSKHSSKNRTDVRDSAARPYGRLRPYSTKPHVTESETPTSISCGNISIDSAICPLNPSDSPFEYNSPIKIMYVSPVTNEEGVKYYLKSAASSSSREVLETFDPCEESSWAETPEKRRSPGTECPSLQMSSVSYPLKCSTSSTKSASISPKSVSPPHKYSSTPPKSVPLSSISTSLKSTSSPPKMASLSPKLCSRRLGEMTPSKRVAGTENPRSPGDHLSFHEITPPKRRPGRPKKLGPQLEKKAKRPIGRPRKPKVHEPTVVGNAETVETVVGEKEEKENKNLKITVVYGRSRRNKRVVSEGYGQLQNDLHETAQEVDRNIDLNNLLYDTQEHSDIVKAASTEWSEELNLVRPVKDKESAPPASSNIKCQRLQGAVPIRKPGRPAKVKISGISVTVTTLSPRQRKIQMDMDVKQSPEALLKRKSLLPEFKSAKEPQTIDHHTNIDCSHTEGRRVAKDEGQGKRLDRPVAVRHSVRVRKPSIYLLHSVATSSSRSYSHSTALLRSSRQLLLNKAINQRKQEKARDCEKNTKDERRHVRQERNLICQDLSQVAAVSVDSIFPPEDTLKWWAASAERNDLNQELVRRIRLVSNTWVSDIVDNQDSSLKNGSGSLSKRSRRSSVVRALFDCPPHKPSSCSMQQLCSWFMQTTETQSLAIVKKASSRNPYEIMHYPRSANKGNVCPSPQAERLRKHIKKFAKTVPKSPFEHQLAQERIRNRDESMSVGNIKRQLFTSRFAPGRLNQGAPWWTGRALSKYLATLQRARARFLTCDERKRLPKRQRKNWGASQWFWAANGIDRQVATTLQPRDKALSRLSPDQPLDCQQNKSADPLLKEDRLSSKAWSPEKLKECRVFLKKINSPDSESTAEEECDSCTVTLDDWSPSAYRFAGTEGELAREDEAVKTERKTRLKTGSVSNESASSAPRPPQEQAEVPTGRQKGKRKPPGNVSTEAPQPPSVKTLRQSRVRGLSGPRWSDFVLEN